MIPPQPCSECGHHRFAVIARFDMPDHRYANAIKPFPVFSAKTDGIIPSRFEIGHFEAWICERCGLTRWYARDLAGLGEMAQRFPDRVRIVDCAARKPYEGWPDR